MCGVDPPLLLLMALPRCSRALRRFHTHDDDPGALSARVSTSDVPAAAFRQPAGAGMGAAGAGGELYAAYVDSTQVSRGELALGGRWRLHCRRREGGGAARAGVLLGRGCCFDGALPRIPVSR